VFLPVIKTKNNFMNIEIVKKTIRNIPDFPKPGIQFKDVSTLFKNPEAFRYVVEATCEEYKKFGITKVVGIESRGFILGSVIACELGAGFVPIRKPGKLPAETFSQTYELEYGTDTLEIHKDALSPEDVVLVHDDLLATGGTVSAAIDLVRKFGVKDIHVNFLVELDFLKGRDKIDKDIPVISLLNF
jgi:adenine phosphoribosyltransferase